MPCLFTILLWTAAVLLMLAGTIVIVASDGITAAGASLYAYAFVTTVAAAVCHIKMFVRAYARRILQAIELGRDIQRVRQVN